MVAAAIASTDSNQKEACNAETKSNPILTLWGEGFQYIYLCEV